MIRYHKLFDLLNRENMRKTDLLKVMSSPTLAKLSKGETINTAIIDKICEFLMCQPGDIMEYEYTHNAVEVNTKEKYIIVKRPILGEGIEEEIMTEEEYEEYKNNLL